MIKNSKKIVCAFQDSGVADALNHFLRKLPEKGHDVVVYAKASPTGDMLAHTLQGSKVSLRCVSGISSGEARNILALEKPDVVITGLSNAFQKDLGVDMTFLATADQAGITSIAVFETPYVPSEQVGHRVHSSVPKATHIITASDLMLHKVRATGVYDDAAVSVLPMPKNDELVALRNQPLTGDEVARIRSVNGLADDDFAIVYFTSCSLDEDCCALEYLAKGIAGYDNAKMLLAFHPKDEAVKDEFMRIVPSAKEFRYEGTSKTRSIGALCSGRSGIATGYRTALLADIGVSAPESNVLVINPTGNEDNDAAPFKLGIAPRAFSLPEIKIYLDLLIMDDIRPKNGAVPEFFTAPNATERFYDGVMNIITARMSHGAR